MCVCLFRHPEALMVLYSVYSGTNWTNGAWLLCFSIHLSIQESIFLPLSCFNQCDLELNWLMGTRYHKYNLLNSELSSNPLMCSPRPFFSDDWSLLCTSLLKRTSSLMFFSYLTFLLLSFLSLWFTLTILLQTAFLVSKSWLKVVIGAHRKGHNDNTRRLPIDF